MKEPKSKIRWRCGILVGAFFVLLSLYPQFYLKHQRGEHYNGATFFYDFDEQAYEAYLQALIDGKPRRNDIYAGVPPPHNDETLLSIQVFPAYSIALPAKVFNVSAETAFIFVSMFSAFLTSLTLFWLIANITKSSKMAAIGTLFVLIFGAVVAGNGALKDILGLGSATISLPFLRRYTPAATFPFFFLLCGIVWLGLKCEKNRSRFVYAFLTGVCFAVLVYSYFFLWTAALAWLFCMAFLISVSDKDKCKIHLLTFWLPLVCLLFAALIPYFLLLSERQVTADPWLALEQTRKFVFFNSSQIFSYFLMAGIFFLIKFQHLKLKDSLTIFIISFALLPSLVFNQQILTDYSLQPFHYNIYIANYTVLLAFVLTVFEITRQSATRIKSAVWIIIVMLLCSWGLVETFYATNYRFMYNVMRDKAVPVNRRLVQIDKENPSYEKPQVTVNFDLLQADNQPTIAPQAVLWSEHLAYISFLSARESRRRYFLLIYYKNKDQNWLRKSLEDCPFGEACKPLFGWRTNRTLSINPHPPTAIEKEEAIREFSDLTMNFSCADASNPLLSLAIIPDKPVPDFSKLDLWYERSLGEEYTDFKLYRLKLKSNLCGD